MLAQGAASLALTLKVQRAKHAINDNFHSYAVTKPLMPIGAYHAQKEFMAINGFGGHSCEVTARSANRELLHKKSSSQDFTGQQYL